LTTEHSEQVLLINWVRAHQVEHPDLALLFAIPNGGTRAKATAFRLRAEGVLAGVPDLFLPVPRKSAHGLFLELKAPAPRGKLSKVQKDFIKQVKLRGYLAEVCFGHLEAIETIENYLEI
jgi:hypothetical protein